MSLSNNLLTLPQALIFVAVVDEGGFGRAASALGLSKSHVSRQVAALEAELGVQLLARTTRSLRVTEAGDLLYQRCADALGLFEEAKRELATVQHEPVGSLRLAVPLSFGRQFLEPPLLEFLSRFPRVEVTVDANDRPVDLIGERFDLAVRVGQVNDPDLIIRRLCTSRRIVLAAPSYLDRHGTPEQVEQLSEHECLLYAHQHGSNRWRFQDGARTIEVPVSGRLRSNSGELLLAAACAGVGIAWLPDFIAANKLDSGELVALLDSNCRQTAPVNAVLPARKHLPLKVRELLSILEAHLTGAVSERDYSSPE